MSAALDCFVSLLERRGLGPRLNGNGSGTSRCPSHDDRNPSLSFRAADRHRGVIAHCFVCTDALTLDQMLIDLGADELETATVTGRTPPADRTERAWVYRDRDGLPLFRVVRQPPANPGERKRFFQQRSDGAGGWVTGLQGQKRVLYRLPEVLAAIARGDVVWFAEGEKNVDDLVSLGLEATCNPMGAGKWRDEFVTMLAGLKRAVLCGDNDEPGRAHVMRVAASLAAAGVEVVVLEFPGAAGRDVSDWLMEQPATERRARLGAYLEQHGHAPSRNGTGPPTAATNLPPAHPPAPRGFPLTDLGNAERLTAKHGHELRYAEAHGSWIAWDGRVWKPETFAGTRCAISTVRSIYAEAAGLDDDARKALARWAIKSESSRAVEAMASLARSKLLVKTDDLDVDAWSLNVENGIVDLKTGELKPHRQAAMMTKLATVAYDPAARHDVWDRFLDRMVPDPEVREFLQRAAGYSLTGDTSEERLFFIHGPTASGKSTFIAALKAVLGDYAETCNFETFLEQRGGSAATTDLARLPGVRLAVSLEVDEGKRLAVALIKTVTGRDGISARHLYQKSFTYQPAFKLWLVANDRPRASASDSALWRRILMVPFEESLAVHEQDPTVKSTLTQDPACKAAVLAWAVQGVRLWLDEGLNPSEAVQRATSDYRREQDTIGDFLDDCCVMGAGLQVSNPEMWKAYEQWASSNGERAMSATSFGKRMKHHGLVQVRTARHRVWHGIRLKNQAEQGGMFD